MRPGQLYRLAWILYLVLAIAGALWIGARQGFIGLRLFVEPHRWWIDVGLGAAAGGLLLGIWQLGRMTTASARELERQMAELLGVVTPAEVIALALLSGFAEELFFRGAVQGAWGWVPATLLFALLHSGPGPAFRLWTAFALIAGLGFAWLTLWRGNLAAAIVAHVLVNLVNLTRLSRRYGSPDQSAPPTDAGGREGPQRPATE